MTRGVRHPPGARALAKKQQEPVENEADDQRLAKNMDMASQTWPRGPSLPGGPLGKEPNRRGANSLPNTVTSPSTVKLVHMISWSTASGNMDRGSCCPIAERAPRPRKR